MTITTSGFYQKNIDLFSRLSNDISDIQVQVSTGKKSLSLKHDVQDVSLLNASEEHKLETTQFNDNAGRIISDLERIDISFEQLQNASVRLKEIQLESSNGFLSSDERKLFQLEIAGIKNEILSVANGRDAFGNGYFSGTSGEAEPFQVSNLGVISYTGTLVEKSLQVSRDSQLRQNFTGGEVFLSAGTVDKKFSIFDAVDAFSQSLNYEASSGTSSNLFPNGATAVNLVMPASGQAAQYKFDLLANGQTYEITSNVYGNDFSGMVAEINSHTSKTGITAAISSGNKITLSGTGVDLKIGNFSTDLPNTVDQSIGVQTQPGYPVKDEIIIPHSLSSVEIQSKLHDVFEHFLLMRTDLGVAAKTAQNVVENTQDILVNLNEDISKIEDADMAELLTKLQGLLTNKEAAQATFSRLSSKNLFDFMG
ncbi:MAG: flagellar hook-associated protein FlgL [Flavobacteriales bacterium]|jgi:flagellar hook-associated protein 3 FlgL|tara:strand:+ start:796 stop:2067 length:1272 start_codon:yes stop_codon:yes gene_type:complete